MSPRDWKERIRDILEAIREIKTFTDGMDWGAFSADTRTQRAVELNLIIIGEATSHIPVEVQEGHTAIPWALMRAMRNRLVHVYFSVDADLLWDTVQKDLPLLETPLNTLIGKD